MSISRLIGAAMTALLVGVAGGQAASGAEAVSIDSCRTLALTHNKQLQISRERINAARYQNKEAFAAYLPGIDFAGGYMYNQKNLSIFDSDQLLPVKTFDLQSQSYQFSLVKNPITGEPIKGPDGQYIPEQVALIPKEAMEFDIHNVFFGAITLTQPVYMGGKIVAMNRITRLNEKLAGAMSNNEAQDIITAVDAAYWQVVSLRAKKELATSYVALLDTLRSNVRQMVEQGVATQSDLLSVEVKCNEAEVDLSKVDNGLVLSRMALAQVCGLPVNTVMTLEDEGLSDVQIADVASASYDMADVYARRQDLEALRIGVNIMEQKARVEMASMLPNLAVVGSYSFSNPNMFNGFKKRFDGAFSVGAMLTIPIWHWGGNYNKYRAAKTQAKITQMQLDDARDMVDLQVSQAAFKARESVKTYNMTLKNLSSAESNLNHARYGFAEGVMTSQNVMEAQTAWLKANSEKIDAMIDVKLCQVYLAKVLGLLPYPEN
ncbi:MAG: TolC family protein [Muribaculaceae bacterium]|nr:TolC family protein [Muribaculaceae bacterium]